MLNKVVYVGEFFFFNDTATTDIYTLSLHDALPIFRTKAFSSSRRVSIRVSSRTRSRSGARSRRSCNRSEEHTSELQSLAYLVCRLLLEKKKLSRFALTRGTMLKSGVPIIGELEATA